MDCHLLNVDLFVDFAEENSTIVEHVCWYTAPAVNLVAGINMDTHPPPHAALPYGRVPEQKKPLDQRGG